MKQNICELDTMIFFREALEAHEFMLLPVMASAVVECRTADKELKTLNEDGEIGLARLFSIWANMMCAPGAATIVGCRPITMLSEILAQVHAYLTVHPLYDPEGLALYVELHHMMDLVAFGIYFGGDILFTAISKVQKKSKKDDDLDLYDFEIETAPQKRSLCVDSIRMLYSGEIDEFVEKELLPDAAETMNALSEAEKTAVSLLLKAYIGFLSEEATVDEQSFPMVKELLSYTQGSKEDGEKDAIDCLMEDTVSRTHRHREYYNNYQRYQLMQVDKERVIMACNIIINDLIGRLYRYDYRFGYDITLASEHSIAKKLSDNWQNEWEVEDYEAGDC